ncbi:RNA polymerase sigma factor [Staphylococcus equorum]|uniref:RNA polymerase sigma factor n=1 Tax=Staphylococcus equorum TaxID=246432 RepID=UPI002980C6A2|nr:sigma-70 family RNA polymerase sigma factor [Staphylococcus equorum]MDW5471669.1 sigma-70 family RNA polymerase sigma factor [Staphylococcus equorum]
MVDENELYKMIFERDDSKILELLYERYESLLFNLAYKITQDAKSSEEVLQDVFMKIWNKKAIFNTGKGKLSTWLITLCRNKAIDIIRKKKLRDFHLTKTFVVYNLRVYQNLIC